jgi:DNA-directed RNA polymerase specialized sigma24 family protein
VLVMGRHVRLSDHDEAAVRGTQHLDARLVERAQRLGRDHLIWPARQDLAARDVDDAVEMGEQLAAPAERVDERFVEGLSPDLEAALGVLTAGEREVVALRVVLDVDAQTASRVLGISPTNCTTRLNRALRKLEEALNVAA